MVLAFTSFALSERFHLPALPFWYAFAAFGIVNKTHKNKSVYYIYLMLIFILILGWNWFKLAGRGIV